MYLSAGPSSMDDNTVLLELPSSSPLALLTGALCTVTYCHWLEKPALAPGAGISNPAPLLI